MRGNVVSEHAARIIKQFMAACCGKSSKANDASQCNNETEGKTRVPRNDLPLERVHTILDRMSSANAVKPTKRCRTEDDDEELKREEANEDDVDE